MPATPVSVRSAAPGIVLLARAGYAAKGIVYVAIGVLAAMVAVGTGGATTDQRGAIRTIGDGPFGKIALAVIGIGLLGYALWRLVAAATDAEGEGSGATSIAKRLAQAGRGLAYAGYQLYRASGDKVKRHLDLVEAGPGRAEWIVRLGRAGIAARAVVFALIGGFLVKAGLQRDSSEAGGIAQSLDTVAAGPFGRVVLAVVALGLVAYGVYQLATARYRRIRVMG